MTTQEIKNKILETFKTKSSYAFAEFNDSHLITLKLKLQFNFILMVICLLTILTVNGQEDSKSFNFNEISENKFRTAIKTNFNAIPIQRIDSSKVKRALRLIDKTYTKQEIELAENELCTSPRCLTSLFGYYPNLDILVFQIQDYHFKNVVFLKDNENFPNKFINRFNGSYGVMSKNGYWVGLERQGSDNYLQVEICQITEKGAWTFLEFNFKAIDINDKEKEPIFWVNANTIYIATIEFDKTKKQTLKKFYEIKFDRT